MAGVYPQEVNYFDKVKEKLHPDGYQEFLKCIDIYSKEIISKSELKNLVRFTYLFCSQCICKILKFILLCLGLITKANHNQLFIMSHGLIVKL